MDDMTQKAKDYVATLDLPDKLKPDYFTNYSTMYRFLYGKQFNKKVMWK